MLAEHGRHSLARIDHAPASDCDDDVEVFAPAHGDSPVDQLRRRFSIDLEMGAVDRLAPELFEESRQATGTLHGLAAGDQQEVSPV
jgi:hypothetical protein